MAFDPASHTFRSEKFKGVVDEAISYFNGLPAHGLPLEKPFIGSGVYGLYYTGSFPLYIKLAAANFEAVVQPIYVGKTTPRGWRTGRSYTAPGRVLSSRLSKHSRSIRQTTNLNLADFLCRFMILEGIEGDIVVPVEAELIRRYRPLWNMVVDGFGNNDPGSGRYNQANSAWDMLHAGRKWAARLTGVATSLEQIEARVRNFLG